MIGPRTERYQEARLGGVLLAHVTRQERTPQARVQPTGNLPPYTAATYEDACAWVYEHAAEVLAAMRARFGPPEGSS